MTGHVMVACTRCVEFRARDFCGARHLEKESGMTAKVLIGPASLIVWLVVAGCAGDPVDDGGDCEGGKCDGPADQSCADPRYGDGTCQTELSCAVPDIDCFRTFADDTEAASWMERVEVVLEQTEGHTRRKVIPVTDPRYPAVRALVDRGWEAFRKQRPVGLLGNSRPALAIVEDAAPNAAAGQDPETGKSAFAVIINTSLISLQTSESARLGLIMHELQHAIGLHKIGDTEKKIRRYYIAKGITEPIGKQQADDPVARTHAEMWVELAGKVGIWSTAALGGLPTTGELKNLFLFGFQNARAANPNGCDQSAIAFNALNEALGAATDPLDGSITMPPGTLASRASIAITDLQTCFASFNYGFVQVYAAHRNITISQAEASLSAEDRALVAGKPFFRALVDLIGARRAAMRNVEAAFTGATGASWSQLRYFSYEEDADDVSVPVLRAAGLDPAGLGDFLFAAVDDATRERCGELLALGLTPPYGLNLPDDHHAPCWRIAHIEQLAAQQ
jgi:hypothetical protein